MNVMDNSSDLRRDIDSSLIRGRVSRHSKAKVRGHPLRNEKRASVALFGLGLYLCFLPLLFSQQEDERRKEEEKPARITEEIVVLSDAPRQTQVSSVTVLTSEVLERRRPLDLSEAIRASAGVHVSVGEKNEFTLKLRGLDSRRIALFLDGVPAHEPFFGSFDLKTVEVASVQAIQVTRGPASVLYGPNTLGGIVNIITRRPSGQPELVLHGSAGENRTRSLGLSASRGWKKVAATTSLLFQDAAGFDYIDSSDGKSKVRRENSDSRRLSFNAKLFYNPSSQTEILGQASYYTSAFGLPPSLASTRPRYWRFKTWDRLLLSAGGFTSLAGQAILRFRAYGIAYNNVLDAYEGPEKKNILFESTYDNLVAGALAMLDIPLGSVHTLRTSVLFQEEIARTQEDREAPWQDFRQRVLSLALEDSIHLPGGWLVLTGVSIDHLNKLQGRSKARFNPLLGLKFSPRPSWEVHLSFARKSRFPSMRSLYAPSFGNPDLMPESGNLWEIGFTWKAGVFLSGALFSNRLEEMIESLRLPDGTRRFYNVGRVSIEGLEVQAEKVSASFEASLSYTYLHHRNRTEGRPLDALPDHSFFFSFSFLPLPKLRGTFTGQVVSSASWFDTGTATLLSLPGYFDLGGVIAFTLSRFEIFLKGTNLLNEDYFTEPGFPCRARTFELGFKIKLFSSLPTPGQRQSPAWP